MGFKSAVKKLFQNWMEGSEEVQTPKNAEATFSLSYHGIIIGILSLREGLWTFCYSNEFQKQKLLSPLVEFPELGKRYETEELWPFFAMRVPSLRQDAVQKIIEKENIDKTNQVHLLRRFGRRTITNPFELKEVGPSEEFGGKVKAVVSTKLN